MCQQSKGKGVCFYLVISMYIYLYYLYVLIMYSVCLYFIYLSLFTNTWPILDSEGIGILFGAHWKKRHFACSHCRRAKQMPFLTISNNIFFKTQGNKLGAIVAPYKHLE